MLNVCKIIKNKKLSYRRGTVRRAILVNSYYVSRGMGVIKVSSSKNDLQGHSRALAMVSFDSSSSSSSSSSSRNEYYLGGVMALLLQDHRTCVTMSIKTVKNSL